MTRARQADTRIGLLRVIGALSVFAYHFMPDAESVLRTPLATSAVWQLIRDSSGSLGVSIFIIVSGLVFSWAWPRATDAAGFVRRRLAALFPLFWWVAVPLTVVALFTGRMAWPEIWKVPFWLSGLGVLSPSTFFPVVDAWWYMALALQLVCLYPLVRRLQDRIGIDAFVVACGAVTGSAIWVARGLHLDYLVIGFAGCRLLEFAVGMTLGRLMESGEKPHVPLMTFGALAIATVLCLAVAPDAVPRAVVAPLIVFGVVGLVGNAQGRGAAVIGGASALSFAFYLSHSPWAKPILAALPASLPSPWSVALGAIASLTAAVLIAAMFQWSFVWWVRWLRGLSRRGRSAGPGRDAGAVSGG